MALPRTSLTSRVIDFLRFPLIAGVVAIHATSLTPDNLVGPTGGFDALVRLVSWAIPGLCVPAFFLFAGYLFYFGVDSFDSSLYLRKLRSRGKTLLIPYLFWNLLFFCVLYIAESLPELHAKYAFRTSFPGGSLVNLWFVESSRMSVATMPVVGQFWFIRDLMVCVVLSPLYWWLIKHLRHFWILLLAVAWLADWCIPVVGYKGFSMISILFFCLGGWLAAERRDMVEISRSLVIVGWLWPIMIAAVIFLPDGRWHQFAYKLSVVTGIIFSLNLAAWLVERKRVRPVALLSASTFFVFAFHAPWGVALCRRVLVALFDPQTQLCYGVVYVLNIAVTLGFSVLVYMLISRLTPRFCSFITGNRAYGS